MSINLISIDPYKIPLVSQEKLNITPQEKKLIVEKLLEAHKLAVTNVQAENITRRGFAANICNTQGLWALATNFNNTRNDISSICAERSAILALYNSMLFEKLKTGESSELDFKIKYICMANNVPLESPEVYPVPCEDCLSWLNTNRYFDNKTIIFSFDKDEKNSLILRAQSLSKMLPFKGVKTSNVLSSDVEYLNPELKNIIDKKIAINLIKQAAELYKKNNFARISNQNITCSILVNDEIISANKIDWTKRWFAEPLEMAAVKAIEKYGDDAQIKAIAYFGDEYSLNQGDKFLDGVVSIKSLGRVRQKYASGDTPLILNTNNVILITSIDDYLPEKFVQGYEII